MAKIEPVEYKELTLELTSLAEQFKEEATDRLIENGSFITGRLARSITPQTPIVKSDLIIVPTRLLEYGKWVDNGAERGRGKQPPVSAIRQWIKLKRINVPTGFTVDSLAWAIATKIGKEGQRFKKARPFLQVSLNTVLDRNLRADNIGRATAQDINNNIQVNANNTPGLNGN